MDNVSSNAVTVEIVIISKYGLLELIYLINGKLSWRGLT
jgi:hypothetical protein